jgi:hypothetical protein
MANQTDNSAWAEFCRLTNRKDPEWAHAGILACRATLSVATTKAHIVGDTAFAVGVNSSNVRKVTR